MKKGLCIEVTHSQYKHLYNIMCSQDEIIDYLNESDDFDPQLSLIHILTLPTN